MGEVNKKNISKTIEYAIEKNFIYYDTAPVYGNGEIDKVLSIYKKEIIVNDTIKLGLKYHGVYKVKIPRNEITKLYNFISNS